MQGNAIQVVMFNIEINITLHNKIELEFNTQTMVEEDETNINITYYLTNLLSSKS